MRWIALLLCLLCSPVSAANLAWDWTQDDGGAADGFKVHYGTASGTYTNTVDVGNVLTWPLPESWPPGTYYFAASAYNAAGESAYSNEAVWIKSYTPSIQPASGGQWQLAWVEGPAMTAFSDNFATDPSSRWAALKAGMTWDSTAYDYYTNAEGSYAYYNSTLGSTDQYVKVKIVTSVNQGIVLRSTGTGSDGFYLIATGQGDNKAWISYCNNTGWVADLVGASWTVAAGDSVGVTITGTGTSTRVRLWRNPTSNTPTQVDGWDSSGDTADVTLSLAGGSSYYANTGLYVGVGYWNAGRHFDDFYGGDISSGASVVPSFGRPTGIMLGMNQGMQIESDWLKPTGGN